MFSHRTNWHRQQNRLAELLESRCKSGKPFYDLTNSNPTDCGIIYPEKEILEALAQLSALQHQPDPRGLCSAREAIVQYYRAKNIIIDTGNIFLTASTSESYSMIFKLLCNAGESVLIPSPSYPLFEYLAQVNDVNLQQYYLVYEHGWSIDVDSVVSAVTTATKAMVIVNPHNPTGAFLKKAEYRLLIEFAKQHHLALIVDEVFIDYAFEEEQERLGSTAGVSDVLTFTLNGISKLCGLPQMKLGWITVSGEQSVVSEAADRLEILCDTFLSVNTSVQVALPELLKVTPPVRSAILQQVKSNYNFLKDSLFNSQCSVLCTEGGWWTILKVPHTKSDEAWTLELLDQSGVYLFPGYFFEFLEECYLVVSLLAERESFQSAVKNIHHAISL